MTNDPPAERPQPSTDQKTRTVQRFWPLVSAFAVLVVAVLIGAVVMLRGAGNPLGFDTEWTDEILEHHLTGSRLKREQPRRLMDVLGEAGLLFVRSENSGGQFATARFAETGVARYVAPI
jgi:hypothetical protein